MNSFVLRAFATEEAFRWLLSLMTDQQEHIDCGGLAEALACWGAEIPEQILVSAFYTTAKRFNFQV